MTDFGVWDLGYTGVGFRVQDLGFRSLELWGLEQGPSCRM